MIAFNIDKNTILVDFIYVARWSYYRANNELIVRISNILKDLTQGSFSNEALNDIVAKSVKLETVTIENNGFIIKSITNRYDELRIAVFEKNKSFDTVKCDITPDIEQKVRAQMGIE